MGDRDFSACTGARQHLSNPGFTAGSDETQEIFGRGILRVQPHSPRRTYFFTFLPDTVDLQLTTSREAYDDRAPCSNGGSIKPSKSHGPSHQIRGKRGPYSSTENILLLKLKKTTCHGLTSPDVFQPEK